MPHVQAFEVEQHGPGGDRLVQPEKESGGKGFWKKVTKAPVRRLFREFDALLANMESKLGQPLFANALYQTLCIHLTQSASEPH